MNSIKGNIKFFLAVALIAAIGVILYRQGTFSHLQNVSLPEYLIALVLLFSTYCISGVQMTYLLKRRSNIRISLADTALLPVSMNVFGYLIPSNGGMIFSVLFLKAKYKVNMVESTSIGFGLVFISLILNGVVGIFFCFYAGLGIGFFIASVLFLLSPLFALAGAKALSALKLKSGSWIARLQQFLQEALRQSVALITQRRVFLFMVSTNLVAILLSMVLYFWINTMLGTGLSFATSTLTVLLLNVSSLIRVVPGNLGVEELIASGIFSVTGSDPMTGALVTLFSRAINLSLTIPLGILHTAINYEKIAEPLVQLRKSFKTK